MTKEDLLVWSDSSMDCYSKANLMTSKIMSFFSQNVCIPKGVNRHPYADVLHEFFEDTKLPLEYKATWDDRWTRESVHEINGLLDKNIEYRIKPPEPVKKYKYAYLDYDGTPSISEHMTEEYASAHIVNRTKATRLDWSVINE